ncbi:tRNA (adenine-N1)-methyltransferase [candidate division WOR-3 bacterium]|nr:tRNA (adenine-N1)-methyltransferase [candidate division WOR-3 bacterium]
MNNTNATIQKGDLVFVYLDNRRQFLVQVLPGAQVQSDFGNIPCDDIIGQPYGTTGKTHLGHAYHCLKPSTADLMFKVKRLTTIVYPKDLGYLLLETTVGPGSRVIEIGTGSGALTLVLAKMVAPDGIVYSYERRDEFMENARKNVERAGFIKNVTFIGRDVAQEGFDDHMVDAVFIDVPEPWEIVPHATRALKGGYHVVAWSPNIEQVKRMVDALQSNGFIRTQVSEIAEREMLVRERGVRPRERGITHTAYLIRAQRILPPSGDKT